MMANKNGTSARVKLHILITAVVMIFIFIHSAMPGDTSTAESDFFVMPIQGFSGLDHDFLSLIVRKAAHCAVYAVLGGCLLLNAHDFAAWRSKRMRNENGQDAPSWGGGRKIALAWAAGTFFALTDEIHQLFVPGRSGGLFDVCLDSIAVAVGAAVVMWRVSVNSSKKTFRNE